MMLDGLRTFLFGAPIPPGGVDAIPGGTREAHHRLRNTAMRMKLTAKVIERDANDLLELLAQDIRRSGDKRC